MGVAKSFRSCAHVELIEAVLKTFTLQYTKTYAIELVKHIGEELKEQPEEWQLLERPVGYTCTNS